MATITKGETFGATETITATKLHNLVDNATITGIVNADISDSANIDSTKLNLSSSGYITTGGNFTITGTQTFSTAPVLPAGTIDAITEIASGLKTGSDTKLVTGTAGTTNNLAKWNADGDLVDASTAVSDFGWQHSGSSVYSSSGSPTSWTDLDLSSVVASNRALVLLKVYNKNSGNAYRYNFRTNGDTADFETNSSEKDHGCGSLYLKAEGYGTVMVETDTSGVIEWIASASGSGAQIWVLGYLT